MVPHMGDDAADRCADGPLARRGTSAYRRFGTQRAGHPETSASAMAGRRRADDARRSRAHERRGRVLRRVGMERLPTEVAGRAMGAQVIDQGASVNGRFSQWGSSVRASRGGRRVGRAAALTGIGTVSLDVTLRRQDTHSIPAERGDHWVREGRRAVARAGQARDRPRRGGHIRRTWSTHRHRGEEDARSRDPPDGGDEGYSVIDVFEEEPWASLR